MVLRFSETVTALSGKKKAFITELVRVLFDVPEIRSVTFTGSFVDQEDLSGISDIDIVVIVGHLTAGVFKACGAAVLGLGCDALGLPGHHLHLNTSFGPLKFDEPGRVVVHLMIYSVADHRTHVLKSPFTCLDWERSPVHAGPSLREIYPVLALQPRQFIEARRGLSDYLDDLAAGSIRFRRYALEGDSVREIIDRQPLDQRHQGEYAYHIVRNLLANYAKLLHRTNTRLGTAELVSFWRTALPRSAQFCEWFTALEVRKRTRATEYPADTLDRTRSFLVTVSEELEHTWRQRAVRHVFVRHARTALNDGRFLGQRRDPGIADSPTALTLDFTKIYSSPALRCRETAAYLARSARVIVDQRLHEIDYGSAEGLTYAELAAAQPNLVSGWQGGEDPRFPGGENTADVVARLESFLQDLPPDPALVVTHNVVLRCLLGSGLGIPMSQWHRVPVSHADPIEVLRLDGRTYLNLTSDQLASITDAIIGYRPC